jgi:tetratricopeptide (TPR) repeat protein
MSDPSLTTETRTRLYGRDELLSVIQEKLLARNNSRILLAGPSGIGKSEFVRGLQDSLGQADEGFVCLRHEIKSSAHTAQDVLSKLTVQLLEQADIPGGSFEGFRAALNQLGLEHSLSLATAALLDVVSAFAPNLKKTTEGLLATLQGAGKASSPRATAERISKTANDDLLAGFIGLVEGLAAKGISGCILLDRVEGGAESVQNIASALISSLPPTWGVVLTVNNEIPEGLKALEQLQPRIAYVGGERYRLEPLDLPALEAWALDVRGEAQNVDELMRVLENCGGRPLYLRDWVHGLMSEGESRLILNNRLGEYYEQRIKNLPENARWLLYRLAIMPENAVFSFEFCQQLLSTTSPTTAEATWDVLSELIRNNFLEREGDGFRIVHAVTRKHISNTLPTPVIKSAAANILQVIDTHEQATEDPRFLYTRLVLSNLAGNHESVRQLALRVGSELSYIGSYKPALDAYSLFLSAAESPENLESSVQAVMGISTVLLQTGHYQDALSRLSAIAVDRLSPETLARLSLLRGEILMRLNRYRQALSELGNAHRAYEELDNVEGQIESEKNVNTILRDLGRYERAVAQAQAFAERARRELPPSRLVASCLQSLARSLAFLRNTDEGLAAAGESLDMALSVRSIRAEGNAHLAFGEVYRHSYILDEAIPSYERAIRIAETIANRDSFLWSALGLADAYLLKGYYLNAQRVLERVGDIVKHAPAHYPLEHLHWQLSVATIDFVNGATKDKDLVAAAEQYQVLDITWPVDYVREIIARGIPNLAKKM